MKTHIDLFSGIGGGAVAVDAVWDGIEHVFCEKDTFCQAVLKKHYPTSIIHGDIRTITADTGSTEQRGISDSERKAVSEIGESGIDILTGGFPCQPFSQAGRRRGTSDDRHLWPEMLRVIREFKPRWVVGENVAGLLTIEHGVVFEQVCLDLEKENYDVIPFVIPACAVNAPHRRDRVWIVAHATGEQMGMAGQPRQNTDARDTEQQGLQEWQQANGARLQGFERAGGYDTDASGERLQRREQPYGSERKESDDQQFNGRSGNGEWSKNWLEVATRFCGVDDGLPARMDGLELSKSKHRAERLKGLGNAWVPQVAIEIMKGIKAVEEVL